MFIEGQLPITPDVTDEPGDHPVLVRVEEIESMEPWPPAELGRPPGNETKITLRSGRWHLVKEPPRAVIDRLVSAIVAIE